MCLANFRFLFPFSKLNICLSGITIYNIDYNYDKIITEGSCSIDGWSIDGYRCNVLIPHDLQDNDR